MTPDQSSSPQTDDAQSAPQDSEIVGAEYEDRILPSIMDVQTIEDADDALSELPAPNEWPWPFDQYGPLDPLDEDQESAVSDRTARIIRKKKADDMGVMVTGAYFDARTRAQKIADKREDIKHQQRAESDTDTPAGGDNHGDSESDTTESKVTASAGELMATPDAIISPDNDYAIHDNIAVDLIKYVRSNTIRNEEQFLLLSLAYASGLSEDPHEFISSVTIGTSSSGKSHLKRQVDTLYNHLNVMDASTGSDKSLIYDDEWDGADIISMGELNQPSEEMIEFMKRAHGGDEEVVIRSTRGNPSQGFGTEVIRKDAKSYHFTFAQWEADFEFWNRLLKIPVHESESKNRAVGRMAFGHGDIDIGQEAQYGFEFDDGTERLRAHMLEMKRNAPGRVVIPTGGELGDWDVWEIVEPMFNHSRSESNRVYAMVSNLIKASARLNFHNRESFSYTERTETGERVTREALVAAPQDVANVLRCIEMLRATTHNIDPRKRAVVEAIKVKSEDDDDTPADSVEGIEPIVEYLDESDASQVKASELEHIIADLEENYLLSVDGDTITARNWDALGMPRVESHAEIFTDCVDPVSGNDFLSEWYELREDMVTSGQDLLEQAKATVSSTGGSLPGEDEQTSSVTSDMPAWKQTIVSSMKDALDGRRLTQIQELPVEAFVGITSPDEPDLSGVSTTGTLLDPTHDVWGATGKPADWVSSETDARRRIQQVIQEALALGAVRFSEVHESDDDGTPLDVTVRVEA